MVELRWFATHSKEEWPHVRMAKFTKHGVMQLDMARYLWRGPRVRTLNR